MTAIRWLSDPVYSEISFKVKYLSITNITGYFKKFTVEIETDTEDFDSTVYAIARADINSINTYNENRDTYLKSAGFLKEGRNKEIKFVGTKYIRESELVKLYGNLTIFGITKAIIIDVDFSGIVTDSGQRKAGFTIHTKISRNDFNLTWEALSIGDNLVIGDEISIDGAIQLTKQAND